MFQISFKSTPIKILNKHDFHRFLTLNILIFNNDKLDRILFVLSPNLLA